MTLLVCGEITVKGTYPCICLLWGHALRRIAYKVAIDQAHFQRVSQAIDSSRDALSGSLIAPQCCLSVRGQLQSFKPVRKFL